MFLMGIPNIDVELTGNFDEFTDLFRLMCMVDDPTSENTRRIIWWLQCNSRLSPLLPFGNNRLRHDLT